MTVDIDNILARWTAAERAGDTRALDTLLADEFVGIGPVGFVLDKRAWVGRFEHGMHHDRLDLDEVAVRRRGDTRVSFTVVDDAAGPPTIAAMQYSFIGPPLGGPR